MKRKSIFSCVALLLAGSCLTACAGTSQKAAFGNNWQLDTTFLQKELTETLEYSVRFEKGSGLNSNYSLSYENGTYTTKLTTAQENGETIYTYETNLQIEAVYQYGTEPSKRMNDFVSSLVKFEIADKQLRPISSHKETLSHSPANSASSLDTCYATQHYSVDITYTGNGAGEMIYKNLDEENSKEIKDSFSVSTKKYTYLDNEQILFALRGINASSSSSVKFNFYSPYTKGTQRASASFASDESMDFSFTKNGVNTKETIAYHPVSLSLVGKNPGATQTLWIAKKTSEQANFYRNVILRLETPLSYNLGTLIYELKSANFS